MEPHRRHLGVAPLRVPEEAAEAVGDEAHDPRLVKLRRGPILQIAKPTKINNKIDTMISCATRQTHARG